MFTLFWCKSPNKLILKFSKKNGGISFTDSLDINKMKNMAPGLNNAQFFKYGKLNNFGLKHLKLCKIVSRSFSPTLTKKIKLIPEKLTQIQE